MNPIGLLVVTLAAARMTRLITQDTITEWLRVRLSDRPFWYELVTCPWCVGFHISVIMVLGLWFLDNEVMMWLSLPWAISYLVGSLERSNN